METLIYGNPRGIKRNEYMPLYGMNPSYSTWIYKPSEDGLYTGHPEEFWMWIERFEGHEKTLHS